MKPKASIIIPSRGMEEYLEKLFSALSSELEGENVEVILVDDGSQPPLERFAKKFQDKLSLKILRQPPLGPASARERGWREAQAEIIIFLDADVIPQKGWLGAILAPFEKDALLAGVEGKTISSNLNELTPFSHFLYNLEGGKYLTCNIAYRRSWLERVGGFDLRFRYPWREDSDLAFRIIKQGGKIIFEPKAVVDHPVRPVSLRRLVWFYNWRRGYDWLLRKKHPELFKKHIQPLVDKSELSFAFSFLASLALFLGREWIAGFIILFVHQAIYHHILLRYLHFGSRRTENFALPWKMFLKAYLVFYPATFLRLASLLWFGIKFWNVKPVKFSIPNKNN